MNAPAAILTTGPKPPKDDAYAKTRSRCIDAFAKLELAVITASHRLGLTLNERALIGQRIKKLADAATLSKVPQPTRAELQGLCGQSEILLRERTDLVHAEMVVAVLETQSLAIFRNSADLAAGKPEARVYTLSSLKRLQQEVMDTAAAFDALGPRLRQDPT